MYALKFISPELLACGGEGLEVLDVKNGKTVFKDSFPGSVLQIESTNDYLGLVLYSGPVLIYRWPPQ